MAILEFFIPSRAADLDDASKSRQDHYSVDLLCEFDVPPRQQLDDLTRMFDSLHREKSPTALFTKPELFSALFSYVKAMQERGDTVEVCRQARHKICHEIGERFKKLLQITIAYVKKRGVESENSALELCLRSTLKMYVFILCTILSSSAPADDDEGGATLSQRVSRKRKRREVDAGFCDDASGVDMDGRELVLTSLIELCSPEILQLWPNGHLEDGAYSTILKMALNMITQKTNISNDSQSIAGALALLLARVSTCTLMKNEELNSSDFVSPLIELSMKSDCAALFLSKFVSDLEQEEAASELRDSILRALFDNMSRAALFDASNDGAGAKNIASFFTEVAKKSVSVTVKMADCIIPILQSDNYDIRKAVITCITEMVLQIYTGPSRCASDAATRNGYLNELLFRIMDVNPFVRNHTLHSWERLIDSKSVPKRYYLAVTEAVVGRLEDRNYLVRDSAMAVICSLMKKNWFGQVLNNILVEQKLSEAIASAQEKFQSELLESSLIASRRHFQPISETNEDPLGDDIPPTEEEVTLSEEQTAIISKIIFFESALVFIGEMNKALSRATILLDSRTERDVVEAIKLIVVCSEYRLEASDKAFLKVLVMVFEGEVKIQLAVRDAFAEVVLAAFSRSQGSSTTRTTASAQKLIAVLRSANEGEISAVDRIFGLLKLNPSYSRHIATKFIEALWGIAEGSIDADASTDDRRTAMHVYSILSKHFWKDLRTRRDSIIDFLNSGAKLDNVLVSFVFRALQNESADPQYIPIETNVNPKHHVVLKHIVTHLCRPTTAVASWMCLAEAAISTIHHLCSVPVTMFNYVLDYLGKFANSRDTNRRAQLFFVVGHTALKQLVAVESAEKQQLKALEEPAKNSAQATAPTDTMHKELGLGSHEYKRHAIQDLAQKRKQAIMQDGSRWLRYSTEVLDSCKLRASDFDEKPYERVCAVMAMCHLMIVSETFCSENLDLLFKIVSDKRESWVVKTNAVIALGDLCCVHPNLLGPYLSVPSAGFLRLLVDDDLRVRAVTIQVCSHLVLGEMLRIRDHLHTIIKLVADPDETIAQNAVTFVQNLALKEKEKTGNLIPPLVSQLSGVMPQDKFRIAMRHLLERVEGDKPTDSLIDRLCQRFDPFSERSKKKRQLAQNIAFCLSELNYTTERSMKRLTSEPCYQQYKHWIRDPEVFEFFKLIAAKAKRTARGGAVTTDQRRDKTLVEEWECRLMLDHSGEPRAGEAQIVDCPSDEDAC